VKKMEDIVILGAGGMAREVAFLIEEINRFIPTWNILGFVETHPDMIGTPVGKYGVIFSEDQIYDKHLAAVIAIGNPHTKYLLMEKLSKFPGIFFPNLIHPSTIWDKESISIGRGNVICPGNVFTTNIAIGNCNICNMCGTYGHDVQVGNCCQLNPAVKISGKVSIGNECLIGAGAVVLQNVEIGDRAVVGAGAVVLKNVEKDTTVFGIPAKKYFDHIKE
jgi:sugar O-acyltransferase (sialic acid O-acetyltransferase NeuD family)